MNDELIPYEGETTLNVSIYRKIESTGRTENSAQVQVDDQSARKLSSENLPVKNKNHVRSLDRILLRIFTPSLCF